MQIFLSYASEDRDLAEEIQLALLGAGHKVFFDKESLPAGGDYHSQIERAVQQSDIFVFLISPNSVAPGSYALTELKFARTKWSYPKGKLLPVRLHGTPWEAIPPYLKSVTVLEPEGSAPAEIVEAVAALGTSVDTSDRRTNVSGVRDEILGDARSERNSRIRHRTQIWVAVAVIGLIAVLGTTLIINWTNTFGPKPSLRVSSDHKPEIPLRPEYGGMKGAADQDEATKAAREILASLHDRQFEKLWNSETSDFLKSKVTEDSFFAELTIVRQQTGSPGESKFIAMAYSPDPSSELTGEGYTFTFVNSYSAGRFYERIVVMKEKDGKFRLASLGVVPAPK